MYDNINATKPSEITEQDVTVEPMGGQTVNPFTFTTQSAGARDRYVYVLYKRSEARSRPTRIMTADDAPESWRIGSILQLWQDERGQAGSDLGEYMIVGLKDALQQELAGDVPDRNDIKWCRVTKVW